MSKTLTRTDAPIKYASTAAVPVPVDDPKVGPLAIALRKIGYSSTDGGAHQRMLRARADLAIVAGVAVTKGLDRELDEYLEPIDELRVGGVALDADDAAWLSIEKTDAADNPARVAYLLDPSPENAKALLLTMRRLHVACLETMRCLRTRHPELPR